MSGPFWAYRTGKTSLSFWYVTASVCSAILCFTICFKGYIVKAKKMLESICVNYGKLKANIVSCIYLPLLVSHPTIPFSRGSLSLSLHPMENPKPIPCWPLNNQGCLSTCGRGHMTIVLSHLIDPVASAWCLVGHEIVW